MRRRGSTRLELCVALGCLLAVLGSLRARGTTVLDEEARRALPVFSSHPGTNVDAWVRSSHAILLENEFIATDQLVSSPWNGELAPAPDPGAYIVQCRGRLTDQFRTSITAAGGRIISYVPNNALLVQASSDVAHSLARLANLQAMVPFAPAHKLSRELLQEVLAGRSEVGSSLLRIMLFPESEPSAVAALEGLGARVVSTNRGPFGSIMVVECASSNWIRIARLREVQRIERWGKPVPATDLARTRLGVAGDPVVATNYHGLTGQGALVAVSDTGIDAGHPALTNRVFSASSLALMDTNGHGTLIAGIIAGDGAGSTNVSSAPGSSLPASDGQFRGMAPAAQLFSVLMDESIAGCGFAMLEDVARTNPAVLNQSWIYQGQATYDLACATYDSAVRDALPGVSGSQPLLIVVAAGNNGGGDTNGLGGIPGSIESPGAAKNVITVGAVEQFRFITNQVWFCSTNPPGDCITNSPWLGITDSSNQVCAWSARGNVGIGLEGANGRHKPDLVAPGSFVVGTRSRQWTPGGGLSVDEVVTNTTGTGNYSETLAGLNEGLAPDYRFEAGTSLAAASVSGLLALMHQFFGELGRTNSPALSKALLINGASSLGGAYDSGSTNAQGWGTPLLSRVLLPGITNVAARPMWLVDQEVANALATRQEQTRTLSVTNSARSLPLHITLVWTDPPANPAVATKLVNDLDLIVTNLDTGEVYLGNHFSTSNAFAVPWDGLVEARDCINNVEVVRIACAGTNYSVSVRAAAVNVNAVVEQTNQVAQDYALVITSGDGQVPDALTLTTGDVQTGTAPVSLLTNTFDAGSGLYGQLRMGERIGTHTSLNATNLVALTNANSLALATGDSNQWRYYAITNLPGYSNALFACWDSTELVVGPLSAGLALPRAAADVDLYVSTNAALLTLDPQALSEASRSARSGRAEEFVYLTNAAQEVYYLAVKCESQEGGEFGLAACFSLEPLSAEEGQGTVVLRGIPGQLPIPDAGTGLVLAVAPASMTARRVVVTNTVAHERPGDLVMELQHEQISATLLNHPASALTNQVIVFDDSDEGQIPGARPSDGPGTLRSFSGQQAHGLWFLTVRDEVAGSAGTNGLVSVRLEPQVDLTNGITSTLLPGGCREDVLEVPLDATNFSLVIGTTNAGRVPVTVSYFDYSSPVWSNQVMGPGTNTFLVFDRYSAPPLRPGKYAVRICNPGPVELEVVTRVELGRSGEAPAVSSFRTNSSPAILDAALTVVPINVPTNARVRTVEVGLHIEHPRVSDLAAYLVSPSGKRVCLVQNRGADFTNGLGQTVTVSNVVPVSSSGGPMASTNYLNTGQMQGTLYFDYEFYTLPDSLRVYYESNLVLDTGMIAGIGNTNASYGLGQSPFVTIVMNEGDNFDENTAWYYVVRWSAPAHAYALFTDDPGKTSTPIKFATPPFTNVTYAGTSPSITNQFAYFPEEPLDAFTGEWSGGIWRLELVDSREGPATGSPRLSAWQLLLSFDQPEPLPIQLDHASPVTRTILPGQQQSFAVPVPAWAEFATNSLSATGPVAMWFNQSIVPTSTNSGDYLLIAATNSGSAVLAFTNQVPTLVPGTNYFLTVFNTNPGPVTVTTTVDYDVVPLTDGVWVGSGIRGGNAVRYFVLDVASNATSMSLEVTKPSGNVTLALKAGPDFPTPGNADATSALPGTNAETILMFTNASPALSPGRWHAGVFHDSPTNAVFDIRFQTFTNPVPVIRNLDNGQAQNGIVTAAGVQTEYFRFVVGANAARCQFEITGSSGDMQLLAAKGLPLPSAADYDYLSDNPWTNAELIVIYPSSSPVPLSPGEWFLGAVKLSPGTVDYTIRATEFAVPGTNFAIKSWVLSSNSLCLTWDSLPGVFYRVEGATGLAPAAWSVLSETIPAIDSETSWCLPLPSAFHFFRVGEGLVLGPAVSASVLEISTSTNEVTLNWTGPICARYQVERTPSLQVPQWVAYTNTVTSTNGVFRFDCDFSAEPGAPRFYRLRQIP